MVEDILSQGGDREPRRWPRRLAVIGAVIVLAVASIVYLSLGHRPHFPAATLPTPVTTSAAAEPDAIGGPVLPWAAGLRLPVAGTQPAWFSPASGGSEPIGSLPADSAGYHFTRQRIAACCSRRSGSGREPLPTSSGTRLTRRPAGPSTQ
jgi:hypothetical protein